MENHTLDLGIISPSVKRHWSNILCCFCVCFLCSFFFGGGVDVIGSAPLTARLWVRNLWQEVYWSSGITPRWGVRGAVLVREEVYCDSGTVADPMRAVELGWPFRDVQPWAKELSLPTSHWLFIDVGYQWGKVWPWWSVVISCVIFQTVTQLGVTSHSHF